MRAPRSFGRMTAVAGVPWCAISVSTTRSCAVFTPRRSACWAMPPDPVINSAVFYLDDFPSPVPSGDGTYIKRDYGLLHRRLYAKVWLPICKSSRNNMAFALPAL